MLSRDFALFRTNTSCHPRCISRSLMLNLKRGPQDPILPIRAAKHPRTTALYADSPTASQNEGLLSQWISSLVNLTTRAASGVFNEGPLSTAHLFFPSPSLSSQIALRAPPPQPSSSHLRSTEVARLKPISAQPISLRSTHLRRGRIHKMRLKGTPPRTGSPNLLDSTPQRSVVISEPHVAFASPSPQPQAIKMVGAFISTPNTPVITPQLGTRRILEASCPSPEPPSTPVPGPSRLTSTEKDGRILPFRPPIPGAFLSPSVETPAPKPSRTPQPPQTEPRAEAKYNPYYRSMAPPPSPNLPPSPIPRPQPPDLGDAVEPLSSTAASTAASTPAFVSPLPAFRDEVDAAIAVVEQKLAGRVVKKVFSRKTARPHIYQEAVSLHTLLPFIHLCIFTL